jgi:hypothetical protein
MSRCRSLVASAEIIGGQALLALEINALLSAGELAHPLFGDAAILEFARRGVRERLRRAATASSDA